MFFLISLLISLLYLLQISLLLIHHTKVSSWRNSLLGIRNKIQGDLLEKWLDRKTWQSYMHYGHTQTKRLKYKEDKADHVTSNKCAGWGQDMQHLGFPQSLQVLSNCLEAHYWWAQTIWSCAREYHKNKCGDWLSLEFQHRLHTATPPQMVATSTKHLHIDHN